jgi:hypothetical protein
MFQAFPANVTAYLFSPVANRLGERLDLDRIWAHQNISSQLRQQLETWAVEVSAGFFISLRVGGWYQSGQRSRTAGLKCR